MTSSVFRHHPHRRGHCPGGQLGQNVHHRDKAGYANPSKATPAPAIKDGIGRKFLDALATLATSSPVTEERSNDEGPTFLAKGLLWSVIEPQTLLWAYRARPQQVLSLDKEQEDGDNKDHRLHNPPLTWV